MPTKIIATIRTEYTSEYELRSKDEAKGFVKCDMQEEGWKLLALKIDSIEPIDDAEIEIDGEIDEDE